MHTKTFPGQAARYGQLDHPLAPTLQAALEAKGGSVDGRVSLYRCVYLQAALEAKSGWSGGLHTCLCRCGGGWPVGGCACVLVDACHKEGHEDAPSFLASIFLSPRS